MLCSADQMIHFLTNLSGAVSIVSSVSHMWALAMQIQSQLYSIKILRIYGTYLSLYRKQILNYANYYSSPTKAGSNLRITSSNSYVTRKDNSDTNVGNLHSLHVVKVMNENL